jgi:predicted permease
MLKNYLKIAFRNLWRHKGYSLINIVGLTVGMACALFILLWVQDEMSYDRFHAKAKTLYRVEQDQEGGQGTFHVYVTSFPMGPGLKAEIPEVKEQVRWARPGTLLVRFGENAFFESRVAAVDPSFFRMFSFPLVQGDAGTALSRPGSLVLTEEAAKKYFGGANPVGRSVTINNAHPFTVTGVVKNIPAVSTLRFDFLVPFDFVRTLGLYNEGWGNNSILTFVQLEERSDIAAVNEKITRAVRAHVVDQIRSDPESWKRIQGDPEALKRFQNYKGPAFMVMPLVDIRLFQTFGFDRTPRAYQSVVTFVVVALFVLLIACINFMNLATARSANRAKEVGLRKVVGAYRKSIAGQFYGESVLTAILSGLAALVLVIVLLPAFNTLAEKRIALGALLSWKFVLGILAVTLVTGTIAGSYPALFLSAFQPVRVLKGSLKGGARSALFRKILVVVQFGLSILLLIGMGIVTRQVDYMRAKKLGYEKEHLVYLPLRGDTVKTYPALKEALLRDPRIPGVTATHQAPTSIGSNSWGADWDGKDPERRVLIGFGFVDFDYPETMKIDMAAGRSFSREFSTDLGRSFLVNEEVPKLMGLDAAAAVGKRFQFVGIDGTIVGVMKNYHYQSVRNVIEPIAVAVGPDSLRFAIVRLKAGDIPASLEAVKSIWRKVNPLYPVEYRFFDEDFGQMYRSDEQMGSILKIFAGMAVIIACLGLFGLASFTAEQRTKEIGVRKVLGASTSGIVVLMTKEFGKWVLVAGAIAWPVAYVVMKRWLQGFAYRTPISPGLFLLAGGGALVVALVTVGSQSIRAALSNPADALKYE